MGVNSGMGWFTIYCSTNSISCFFTNIPVDETIEKILVMIRKSSDHNTKLKDLEYNGVKWRFIKKSLKWCLSNNIFLFNGLYYKQIDGCAMGSPLASLMADIFMNSVIESAITSRSQDQESPLFDILFESSTTKDIFNVVFFGRYVDDTLAAFKSRDDAHRFLTFLNSLHTALKFTMEEEKDGVLGIPFLDIEIQRTNHGVTTTVYRKITHSGVYTHWLSFCPNYLKHNLVQTLLHRAWMICSNYTLWHSEVQKIKNMLMSNGYNKCLIEHKIGDFLNNKMVETNTTSKCEKTKIGKTIVYLKLPYLGEMSYKVKKSIYSCLKQLKCNSIQLSVYNNYSKLKDHFGYKDSTPKVLKSGVVYKVSCSCSKVYIGETARNFITRCKEHLKITGKTLTEIGRHLRDNPSHEINSHDPEYLGFCNFSKKRKIMESLYIQNHSNPKTLLNENESSVKLYLFNIPTS